MKSEKDAHPTNSLQFSLRRKIRLELKGDLVFILFTILYGSLLKINMFIY